MNTFTPDADRFRFYEDGTESGSSPAGGEDVNVTRNNDSDDQIHLRYRVQETGGATGVGTDDWTIEYDVNSLGSWVVVTASSSRVQADTGSLLTDAALTTNRGTDGIADGSGSFVAGEQEDGDGEIADRLLSTSNYTEHVWALLLVSADNSDGDTLDFRMRLNGGTPGMANTVTPRITIEKGAAPTPQAVGGTLTFAGDIAKKTIKATLDGTLTFAGDIAKNILKATLDGTLTFAGAIAKKISKATLDGTLTFGGTLDGIKKVFQAVGGTLTFAGDISKKTLKATISGTLTFAGAIFKKITPTAFGGTLTFGGTLGTIKKVFKSIGGTLTFAGDVSKKTLKATIGGTLAFVGVFARKLTAFRSLGGTLTFGGLVGKSTSRGGAGTAFVNGPWLLYTRDTTANIWFQLDDAGTIVVTINNTTFSKAVSVDPWTGHVAVTGLTADTLYAYTLSLDGTAVAGSWTFRTMPTEGSPGRFRFTLESDNHIFPIWNEATETFQNVMYQKIIDLMKILPPAPHFSIAPGDTEAVGSKDLATRRTSFTTVRKLGWPSGARMNWRGNTPIYNVWDDWDYLSNNSAGQEFDPADRIVAETVWREFFDGAPATSEANAIYHTFKVADCVFLMLDNRTYREGTLGTQTPGEVNPWNYLDTNDAWGATQLAWIKSTLAANKDAPFKVIVNGCNLMDRTGGTGLGDGRRDSIGIYHRRERNELFQFLKDNPEVARGLLFLKGDDHKNMCHHERFFAPPEPILNIGDPTDPGLEKTEYASITQAAAGMLVQQIALDAPWAGHTGEKFKFRSTLGAVLVVDVDTVSDQKTMQLRWYDFATSQFLYSCHCVNDEWYFPTTTHRSLKTGGRTEVTHTPDATPGDTWTPDPDP